MLSSDLDVVPDVARTNPVPASVVSQVIAATQALGPTVIDVRGIGKTYKIKHQEQAATMAEAVLARAKRFGRGPVTESFEALAGVDFHVRQGEALGIIGRNGAGKSTLLKVLTRITAPTRGEIDVRGRIGSLLEVGTGFHPELTARENIYLNGSILGMRKSEIDRSFDSIVDFSGVERFLDTPVKRFSSGMYVRLAFAVAAHLPSEILLIDEVLAVGDAVFKSKSMERMKSVTRDGRTILFVSHHLPSIEELCTRVLVLHEGRVIFDGDTRQGLEIYREMTAVSHNMAATTNPGAEDPYVLREFRPVEPYLRPVDDKVFFFEVDCRREAEPFMINATIYDSDENAICKLDSYFSGLLFDAESGTVKGQLIVKNLWLKPGVYTVSVVIYNLRPHVIIPAACSFTVSDDLPYHAPPIEGSFGGIAVLADYAWEIGGS